LLFKSQRHAIRCELTVDIHDRIKLFLAEALIGERFHPIAKCIVIFGRD
jgi:hypothetical protein